MSDRFIGVEFDGMYLRGLGAEITATCIVRNEVNGWRRPDQVLRTFGSTRPLGLAYQPRPFPPGEWEITRIIDCHPDSVYWPVYLDTKAEQPLHEWEVDEEGRYLQPTGNTFHGRGYGIHHARVHRDGKLVPSGTTLGCINIIDPDDAMEFGRLVREAFAYKRRVYLHVPRWEDWR